MPCSNVLMSVSCFRISASVFMNYVGEVDGVVFAVLGPSASVCVAFVSRASCVPALFSAL